MNTHSKLIGYLLWIVGFTGAHRFYFGKPLTGTLWFLTGGFFLVGWLIDLLLIPGMDRQADRRYATGAIDYSIGWLLLTFLGVLGAHRFYMGKWISGLIYLLISGMAVLFPPLVLFIAIGYGVDLFTLNGQIHSLNRRG
ncbi:MAG: NINE protein [Verrucomicrobia bacterium]|jgi:TM2 domain-containing membrane protein YozV|nr:NINE protein [Verrucomicrobiota bacterium]